MHPGQVRQADWRPDSVDSIRVPEGKSGPARSRCRGGDLSLILRMAAGKWVLGSWDGEEEVLWSRLWLVGTVWLCRTAKPHSAAEVRQKTGPTHLSPSVNVPKCQ